MIRKLFTDNQFVVGPMLGNANLLTVDQLMFAALNVRVLVNLSISPAINVCEFGSQQIGYSNCKKCSCFFAKQRNQRT